MHRIDGPGATEDNKFTQGDPVTGVRATEVTADWLNDFQENGCKAIEGAGLTLEKGNHNQLLSAIMSAGGAVVNVKDPRFGAKGDGVTDDTAAIQAAIDYASDGGRRLFIPSGRYIFDGFSINTVPSIVDICGEEGDLPVLVPSQAAVDAGNTMFRIPVSRASAVTGLTLTADIKPNQREIAFASVAGLAPGMILQISSNQLWHNGDRGVYYRGEIHRIVSVNEGSSTVLIEDFTRDLYETTDTLTIRAWIPNRVSIRNLRIEAPYPATVITSAGISLQQCADAIIDNVHLHGFQNSAIVENLCWNSRFTNIHVTNDDDMATAVNGYGIESNGSVGTFVDGLYTKGCRRAFDAGAISGTELAAVCRDWTVQNFIVRGGGAWYPDTAAISYGIGMHGPSENGTIRNGHIQDCRNGITARGRNTLVESVTFSGSMYECVSLHENGAGLIVRNCTYDSFNYPNKLGDIADAVAGSGCKTFVKFGIVGQTSIGTAFFDLPVVIENNACKGLTESFIQFAQNDELVENVVVRNNYVEATPGAGNTFTVFDAPESATNVSRCYLERPRLRAINGEVMQFGSNLVLGYRDQSDCAVQLDEQTYVLTLPDDTVGHIPRFSAAQGLGRTVFAIMADAGGDGIYRIVPESVTSFQQWGSAATIIEASANGAAMTGTTGNDSKITVGLMSNGDLYIENRNSNRVIRVSRII